ncbi:MAG: YtxH domain-containing protein, partial [Thermomicrobiales bacterium]
MVDVEIGDAKRALHQLRSDLEKRAVLAGAQHAAQAAARRIEDRIPDTLHAVQLPDFAVAKLGLVDQKALQQAEDRAANRGFVGGFLVGALVGAILALIFAPRRGAETRDLIAHTASDVTEKVTGVV